MIYKVTSHISTLYIYQISSTQELLQEKKKLINEFILYIQETSYIQNGK